MKNVLSRCIASGAIVVSLIGVGALTYVSAQEGSKSEKSNEVKADKKQSTERLPRNYGKIGLTEAQRKSIYEIVGRYESQIDELEKKIAELKVKEASECEAILNPNQRQSLNDLTAEAKKKASSKKKDAPKDGGAKDKGDN